MAKKVDDDSAEKNTFDPARVEKIVRKIEGEHEGLLTERMSYMGKCRPYRERIGQHYEEAAAFGIPKKILKAKIKERDLRRQIDGIPDDFEDDDRESFEQVSQALGDYGDLPLGKAAKERAAKADAAAEASPAMRERGRPRKATSPEAESPAASAAENEGHDLDADHSIFSQGYEARENGARCSVPVGLEGDDRDRWRNGWLAADWKITGDENAERLGAGISPLQ